MLTVADGGVLGALVIEEHPAKRRIVIPVKAELMMSVFIVREVLIWFVDSTIILLSLRYDAYRTLGQYHTVEYTDDEVARASRLK